MKKKSLGINAGLNTIKTLCAVLFPLITFPYVSRVLHVENIGIFNFCSSVVSYFTLIAGLGINAYAIREGARYRDKKKEISQFASEVFSINVISAICSCLLLIVLVVCIPKLTQYAVIICLMAIMIPLTTIGCEWVFNIYEEFAYITIRTIAFQLLALVLMFLFVKTQKDLVTYTIVSVVSLSGANVVNAVSRRKYCRIRFVMNKRMIGHLMPIFVLFANSLAVTIYVNSDVTLMGIFAGNYQTGLYSVSSKIYLIVKQMVSALIIVSVPRLAALIGKNELEMFQKTAEKVFGALVAIVVPTVVGLFCIAENTILIIAGREYIGATSSLRILSAALFFCIFSWFYTSCVLIPFREEKKVLFATVASAAANLGLNMVLIPVWGQVAAASTTVIAEFLSMSTCYVYARNYFRIRLQWRDVVAVIAGCFCIFLICRIVRAYVPSLVVATIVSIGSSAMAYSIVLVLFKHTTLAYFKEIIGNRKH